MRGEPVWLVRGTCFQVAHTDPRALVRQWERDPTFRAIQETARAAPLALIPVADADQHRLIITIGRVLTCLSDGAPIRIIRDPCDNQSPAAEALRIRLRVFLVASGYATNENAGLVLLAPSALCEWERVLDRPDALNHQLERLTALVAVESKGIDQPDRTGRRMPLEACLTLEGDSFQDPSVGRLESELGV